MKLLLWYFYATLEIIGDCYGKNIKRNIFCIYISKNNAKYWIWQNKKRFECNF